MDMTSWKSVLGSLKTFIFGGFCAMLAKAVCARSPGGIRSAFGVLLALLTAAAPALQKADDLLAREAFTAVPPAQSAEYHYEPGGPADDADFYVSPDGDDSSDGSFEHPFLTPQRAAEAVSALDRTGRDGITVAFMAGEYRVSGISLTAEDSGTPECPVTWRAYGDGEVAFNGGVSLPPEVFGSVTDEEALSRLSENAGRRVLCADLGALGIDRSDYGGIYAVGTYHFASMYSGGRTGPIYSELFINDESCSLARYPDSGFVYTGRIVSVNDGRFRADGSVNPDFGSVADPLGETFEVDETTAGRVKSWKSFDDVWMLGFWKYDWADGSTPIASFDEETGALTMRFASFYGIRENAPYFFYNVFEELDSPGEFYLDRENGLLYVFPPENFAEASVDISLSTSPILTADNVSYFELRDIVLKGTRGDGIRISGSHNTVRGCTVKNIAGSAINISGTDNTVCDTEITGTGRGGISLSGGDTATLTPGNNVARNNLIHDWSRIYKTYQPAVSLYGVGNVCEHNEIYNSPHEAITYSGNDHVIAYNRIHDVCLISSDAGAIYAGRSWICYGNKIMYNCIYDLGSGGFTPCGIYMDDALSGQTIIGNLLVNIPGYALHLGGGRDLTVKNNIIVSGGQRGISYDQRAIDGVAGGWFAEHSAEGGTMWRELLASPWQSETWQEAFPQMKSFSFDFSDTDSPDFVANPAGSVVSGNLFITGKRTLGEIGDKVFEFSEFSGNALFMKGQLGQVFTDPGSGEYLLNEDSPMYEFAPDFEQLPLSLMGRYPG